MGHRPTPQAHNHEEADIGPPWTRTPELEIGSRRGRNSHQMGVLGIYDLQGLSYGRTELLVADMRLLAPDPSGTPRVGRCQ